MFWMDVVALSIFSFSMFFMSVSSLSNLPTVNAPASAFATTAATLPMKGGRLMPMGLFISYTTATAMPSVSWSAVMYAPVALSTIIVPDATAKRRPPCSLSIVTMETPSVSDASTVATVPSCVRYMLASASAITSSIVFVLGFSAISRGSFANAVVPARIVITIPIAITFVRFFFIVIFLLKIDLVIFFFPM